MIQDNQFIKINSVSQGIEGNKANLMIRVVELNNNKESLIKFFFIDEIGLSQSDKTELIRCFFANKFRYLYPSLTKQVGSWRGKRGKQCSELNLPSGKTEAVLGLKRLRGKVA